MGKNKENGNEVGKTYTDDSISTSSYTPMSTVLFFIKAAQGQDPTLMNILRSFFERIFHHGHSPNLIVSHLNGLEKKPIELREQLKYISTQLGLPEGNVFPFYGYHGEASRSKNSIIDKNAVEILKAAITSSDKYLKKVEGKRA